jgi:hypothetical protein
MSINLAIMKIKGVYHSLKSENKFSTPRRIEKQKNRIFSIFNISKKSILNALIIMLDFHPIGLTVLTI